MANQSSILHNLVPITQFNRGQASRIFDRLNTDLTLVVMKNNQPAAIILSPDEYYRLCDTEERLKLFLEAYHRILQNDAPLSSMEEVMAECGITREEPDVAGEVELE